MMNLYEQAIAFSAAKRSLSLSGGKQRVHLRAMFRPI
jgi:hypothetical protein